MTFQSAISDALLDPSLAVPEGITRPDGTKATKRFDVYRNNVIISLIDALGAAFPLIKRRVGNEFFGAMANIFVRKHPPNSPLMILYGEQFPEFLNDFEPAATLPWLPDLARLERARLESHHESDAKPDGLANLAGLSADKMMRAQVRLLPSVRILKSDHPILSIWCALEQDKEFPQTSAAEHVLVARPEMGVEMHLLPPGGADFLEALVEDMTLGVAVERAALTHGFDLDRTVGSLFEARLVASISVEKNE